jgi:transcriptional regulator with XRE-family HTH domain
MPIIGKKSEAERLANATPEGIELRVARRSASVTLVQLAEHLGCTPSYLSIIETGGITPQRRKPYQPSDRVVEAIKRAIAEIVEERTRG